MGCGGRGSVGAKRRSQGGLWLVSGFAGAQTNGADAYGEVVWAIFWYSVKHAETKKTL
jgi:hypothetical protein